MNKTRYNLDKLMRELNEKKTELNKHGFTTISEPLLFEIIENTKERILKQ